MKGGGCNRYLGNARINPAFFSVGLPLEAPCVKGYMCEILQQTLYNEQNSNTHPPACLAIIWVQVPVCPPFYLNFVQLMIFKRLWGYKYTLYDVSHMRNKPCTMNSYNPPLPSLLSSLQALSTHLAKPPPWPVEGRLKEAQV